MQRLILLKNLAFYTRNSVKSLPRICINAAPSPSPSPSPLLILSLSKFRFFSSSEIDNDSSATTTAHQPVDSSEIPEPDDSSETQEPNSSEPSPQDADLLLQSKKEAILASIEDVSNKELKERIEKYFKGDEEALPDIMEAILRRKLIGNHDDTDDELMEKLYLQPLDDVKDEDFESDREELLDTDDEIDNLYDTTPIVQKRMADDPYFNMDDKKWDEMINEAMQHGCLRDVREAEEVLEEMLSWDKLLPDEIKKKVEDKFNELGDMCERGELEPEEAYKLFKEFEDETVLECAKMIEEQDVPESDVSVPESDDDPPGTGPILRWETRCVFCPGGDAWHPKNRKVKMAVTVKELGLSKHQFRRLRDLVGKRYHPGKDELTITSERYEHREENRKDCLRTLYSLLEEARKANKMVDDARASYCKDKLRANPVFMEKLRAKVTKMKSSNALPA